MKTTVSCFKESEFMLFIIIIMSVDEEVCYRHLR